MAGIVATTNAKLRAEFLNLGGQQALLEKDLEEVKTTADGIMNKGTKPATEDWAPFLKENLHDLGKKG